MQKELEQIYYSEQNKKRMETLKKVREIFKEKEDFFREKAKSQYGTSLYFNLDEMGTTIDNLREALDVVLKEYGFKGWTWTYTDVKKTGWFSSETYVMTRLIVYWANFDNKCDLGVIDE